MNSLSQKWECWFFLFVVVIAMVAHVVLVLAGTPVTVCPCSGGLLWLRVSRE